MIYYLYISSNIHFDERNMKIMLNLWWIYVIIYLILYVIYTQYYKIATKNSNNTNSLTSLLRFISGITILIAHHYLNLKFLLILILIYI